MKIAIASSGLGRTTRGVESWAQDLAGALAGRGVEVALCKAAGPIAAPWEHVIPCLGRDAAATRRLLRILPRPLAWRCGLASPYQVEQTTFALRLLLFLRWGRFDLLHVQDPLVAQMAQKAFDLGIIPTRTILAHGTQEPPAFLQQFAQVQHLSPFHDGPRHSGCAVIPNFVDEARFFPGSNQELRDEMGLARDERVVLCVAALRRTHKRIDYLIDEMARLPEPRPFLLLAGGRTAESDELAARAQALLGGRVRVLPDFPPQRMPELYRAADVLVLCSLEEMMPLALLEGTASGLPSLIHRHPVMQWIAGPGGLAIDMAQNGALAEALRELLGDPQRRRLGSLAREHCVAHFSRDRVVGQILEFYGRTLGVFPSPLYAGERDRVRGRTTGDRPLTPTLSPAYKGEGEDAKCSVIIPTFNCAEFVPQAIDSVLAQTHRPDEILVIDDGSTDDTPERLKRFGSAIRYFHQANRGVAAARNLGLAHARGEWIAFLDADDVWHPHKLQVQLDILQKNPDIALLGTEALDWPKEKFPAVPSGSAAIQVVSRHDLATRNRLIASSVVLRRKALDGVGGFDESLQGPEDYDLWLRVSESLTIAKTALKLVGYRRVPGSLSQQAQPMERGLNRIRQKLAGQPFPRRLLRKGDAACAFTCALMYAEAGRGGAAFARTLESLLHWPLPLLAAPWARLKRLVRLLWGGPSGVRPGRRCALRVMHVVQSLDCGGLERVLIDLLRSAKQLGQQAEVICLERPGIWAYQARALGARVHCLDKGAGFTPGIFLRLAGLLRRRRPDVVHTHQSGPLLYAGVAARCTGVRRLVHTQHGQIDPRRSWFKWAARLAKKFFCVSEDIAQRAASLHLVGRDKITVVPNGIDVSALTVPSPLYAGERVRVRGRSTSDRTAKEISVIGPLTPTLSPAYKGEGQEVKVIGTVGRLSPVKRQDLLLQALVHLPGANLLVVGDGELRSSLQELSRQLGVEERVQWAGFQADTAPYLAAMDVFALPSRFEGMPLAVLEAWRCGVPVVASRVGGLPEMIRDGHNGLLFAEGNLDELIQALARLLADAPLRRELARAGSQELQRRFGSQRMAQTYDRYYRTAA